METRACSQIKTCRTCNNHLPYIREEDLPAGRWAPSMAASRSHWMFSLSLIRKLLNISHNYFITGIHEKKSCSCWNFCFQHSRWSGWTSSTRFTCELCQRKMKYASSANIPWHTSPILFIHFRAHWHACCFIALLLLEHLLCVPKVQKARRKRKKSAFFLFTLRYGFFFAGDEIDCRNSESSAGLDGHTKGNFQW